MRHCVEEIPCFLNQTATINLMRDRISYPRKKLKAKKKEELTQPRGKRRPKKIKNLFTCLWLWTVTRSLSCCHYKKKPTIIRPPQKPAYKNPPLLRVADAAQRPQCNQRPSNVLQRSLDLLTKKKMCCNVSWQGRNMRIPQPPRNGAMEASVFAPFHIVIPTLNTTLHIGCCTSFFHDHVGTENKDKMTVHFLNGRDEIFSFASASPSHRISKAMLEERKLHTHVYAFWKEKKKRDQSSK